MLEEPIDYEFLKWLRWTGIVEAYSTLILFLIAMPLKYGADMPQPVTVVGYIHGILFSALVFMFMLGVYKVPLSRALAFWGVIGAIFPFGPFVVDRWLKRMAARA